MTGSRQWRLALLPLIFLSLAITSTSAQAHTALVSSFPSAGSVITEFPEEIELRFNESLLDLGAEGTNYFELASVSGKSYPLGPMVVSGPSVTARLGGLVPVAGEQVISYRVVASDGHVLRGTVRFIYQPEGSGTDGSNHSGREQSSTEGGKEEGSDYSVLILSILIALTLAVALALLAQSGDRSRIGSDQVQ